MAKRKKAVNPFGAKGQEDILTEPTNGRKKAVNPFAEDDIVTETEKPVEKDIKPIVPNIEPTVAESSSLAVAPDALGSQTDNLATIDEPNENVKRLRSSLFGDVPDEMTDKVTQLGQIPEQYGKAIGNLPLETLQSIDRPIFKNQHDPNIQSYTPEARSALMDTPIPMPMLGLTSPEKLHRYSGMGLQGFTGIVSGIVEGADWLGVEGGHELANEINDWARKYSPQDPTFDEKLMSGVVSMGTFFLPTAPLRVLGFIPKVAKTLNLTVPVVLEAITEAGGTRNEMLNEGVSEEDANRAATTSALANALAIGITNKFGILGEGKEAIHHIIASGLEGSQELFQGWIDKVLQGKHVDVDELMEDFAIGAIIGEGAKVTFGSGSDQQEQKPLTYQERIRENQVRESLKPENAQQKVEETSKQQVGDKINLPEDSKQTEEILKDEEPRQTTPEPKETVADEVVQDVEGPGQKENEGVGAKSNVQNISKGQWLDAINEWEGRSNEDRVETKLNEPKYQEEVDEKTARNIKAIEDEARPIAEESNISEEKESEVIEQIETLVNDIDENLELMGYYDTEGEVEKDITEMGSNRPEKNFKKDLTRFAKEIQKGLGYEDHFDKKGRKNTVSTNIAPIGGEGTIILWKPNSNYGVYISPSVYADEGGRLSLDTMLGKRFMWRVTTKDDVYTGLQNQWVQNDIKAGEFARMIKTAVDRAEANNNDLLTKPEKNITLESEVKDEKSKPTNIEPDRRSDEGGSTSVSSQREPSPTGEGESGAETPTDVSEPEQSSSGLRSDGKISEESEGVEGQRTSDDDAKGISETPQNELVDTPDERDRRNVNYDLRGKEPVHLTKGQRKQINAKAKEILAKEPDQITDEDREILRQYTGEGGLSSGETRESLNQHYTDYPVIESIHKAIEDAGIPVKTALEPAVGSGNFVGIRPDYDWTTIDIDETNYKIVKALYPKGTHYNVPFEKYKGKDFDLIISNVPFLEMRGAEGMEVRPDVKHTHDLFFVHALDKVKPNGVVAFVTSKGTMDKQDSTIREEIVSKADIIGAFRLPGGTFEKNAHTSVITDIIFMQKRPEGAKANSRASQRNKDFVKSSKHRLEGDILYSADDGLQINDYYGRNFNHILGDLVVGKNKLYGGKEQFNVEGDADLSRIKLDYTPYETSEMRAEKKTEEGYPKNSKKFFEYAEQNKIDYKTSQYSEDYNDNIYIYENNIFYKIDEFEFNDIDESVKIFNRLPAGSELWKKIHTLNAIKDAATQFQDNGTGKEYALGKIRDYKNDFEKHPTKDKELKSFFEDQGEKSQYLEISSFFDKDFNPAKVFSEQTRFTDSGKIEIDENSTLKEIAFRNEDEKGVIWITKAEGLTDKDIPELIEQGYSLVDNTTVQNDILYYSGDVYKKIDKAKESLHIAKNNTFKQKLESQIERLNSIKPEVKHLDDLDITGSESWFVDYFKKLFNVGTKWNERSGRELWDTEFGRTYDNYLNNNQLTALTARDRDGNEIKLSEQEIKERIANAEEEVKKVKERIKDRIKRDPHLVEEIVDKYNRLYRNYVKPDYQKASYLIQDVLDEIPKEVNGKPFSLRRNQIDWVVKAFYEGIGINAHDVGGGKTFSAITLARVLKKKGIAKKPIFIVPAKTITKWERDIKTLFPNAKIYNLGNLPADKRTSRLFEIANNQADYVLITQEGYEKTKLPLRDELRYFDEIVAENFRDPEKSGRSKSMEMENIEKFRNVIKKTPRDRTLTFDKLGFDAIFSDEAHAYKNIGVSAELAKYKLGIPFSVERTRDGKLKMKSKRSYDFRFKAQYVSENNNGKNIFLLTATPTPNKPLETYTMLRHLSKKLIQDLGFYRDVDWKNNFFEVADVVNPKSKKGFDKVISKIINAQELRTLMDRFVDKLPMDQMPWIKLPEAKIHKHYLKQSHAIAKIMDDVRYRIANAPPPKQRQPGDDTVIAAYTGGRTGSVDPRLYDGVHARVSFEHRTGEIETDKIELCTDLVSEKIRSDKNAGQIIFMDISGKEQAAKGKLYKNLHEEIKEEISKKAGIHKKQIAIISGQQITDPNTGKERKLSGDTMNKAKQELVDLYNKGDIRVIIGTTKSAGEGMDIQVKTTDIHHIDIPYTPGEYQQRNGRGIRFGNENDEVSIHYYFMQGSFDEMSFNIISRKKGWNEAVWDKEVANEIDTAAEMLGGMPSEAEIRLAMETNPVKRRKMEIEIERDRLVKDQRGTRDSLNRAKRRLASEHQRLEHHKSQEQILTRKRETLNQNIKDKIVTDKKHIKKQREYIAQELAHHRRFLNDWAERETAIKGNIKNAEDIFNETEQLLKDYADKYLNGSIYGDAVIPQDELQKIMDEHGLTEEDLKSTEEKEKEENLKQEIEDNLEEVIVEKPELSEPEYFVYKGKNGEYHKIPLPGNQKTFNVLGEEFFAHRFEGTWRVTHKETGFRVVGGYPTKQDNIDNAKHILTQNKDKLQEIINKAREDVKTAQWKIPKEMFSRFITEEQKRKAWESIKNNGSNINSMIDVTMVKNLKDWTIIAAYHLENIYYNAKGKLARFNAFSKEMLKEYGPKIRKYLRKLFDKAYDILSTPIFDYNILGVGGAVEIGRRNRENNGREPGNSREERPQQPSAWEQMKDDWFGERDWEAQKAWVEAKQFEKRIKLTTEKENWKDVNRAIHVYIDLKRNPGHLQEYYDQLTPKQQKIVDLSQNLTPEQKVIADELEFEYSAVGEKSLEAGLIQNVLDNYVNRVWDIKKGGNEFGRKFGTSTRHSNLRVLDTILEGWSKGLNLKIEGATNNLAVLKIEIANVIENKKLIKEGMKQEDEEGNKIFTHQHLEGYEKIEHPNFTSWGYAGSVELEEVETNMWKIADELPNENGEYSKPIQKLTEVVQEALMGRGMSAGEAGSAIERLLKANKKGEVIAETIDTIRERDQELKKSKGGRIKPTFGKNRIVTGDGTILERKSIYAPKKIAKNLNNILGSSKLKGQHPFIDGATTFNAQVKAIILQTSLFHHLAFTRSYVLGGGLSRLKEANIFKAYKEGLQSIEEAGPEIELLVRNGLTLGKIQDWDETLVTRRNVLTDKIDRMGGITEKIKDKILDFQERQAHSLFAVFGAGLKAKAALLEYQRLLEEEPQLLPNERAKLVANLVNDDFGGLHLQRLGRNPTVQHIFRLFALAPDWTESNIRSMVKAIKGGNTKAETRLYRRFWRRIAFRGGLLTTSLNLLLALWDDEDEKGRKLDWWHAVKRRYQYAWDKGGLRWLDVDITPLYRMLGGDENKRSYFSIFGHFRDPVKFTGIKIKNTPGEFPSWDDFDIEPITAMHHKGSVIFRIFYELWTGHDWKGGAFTSYDELLGVDDKGEYKVNSKKYGFKKGDPKGGKLAGKLTKFALPKDTKHVSLKTLPSYTLTQIKQSMPIQIQNLYGFMSGEIDGINALAKSLGFHMTATKAPKYGSNKTNNNKKSNKSFNKSFNKNFNKSFNKSFK